MLARVFKLLWQYDRIQDIIPHHTECQYCAVIGKQAEHLKPFFASWCPCVLMHGHVLALSMRPLRLLVFVLVINVHLEKKIAFFVWHVGCSGTCGPPYSPVAKFNIPSVTASCFCLNKRPQMWLCAVIWLGRLKQQGWIAAWGECHIQEML